MSNLAPIVLFVFRKPKVTERVLNALSKNPLAEQSTLYIYADGPKENASPEALNDIKKVRQIIRKKKWCKEVIIIECDKNKGLANSVITGVTEIVNKHGRVIVMDDDQLPAKGFLKYLNDALNLYEKEERVFQISGYVFPFTNNVPSTYSAHFIPLTASPAWGTWKRAWDKFAPQVKGYEILKTNPDLSYRFDVDGIYPYTQMLFAQMEEKKVDSWAIRWWWTVFKNKGLALSPDKSLTQYLPSGAKATHVKGNDLPFTHHDFDKNYLIKNFPSEIIVNEEYFDRVKDALKKITDYSPKYSFPLSFRLKKIARKIVGNTLYDKARDISKNFYKN